MKNKSFWNAGCRNWKNQIQQEVVKKADTERFLALVKKYRDCHELTDAMLYSFIESGRGT